MRAIAMVVVLAALAVPARADHACAVRVVRAPVVIRAEIERWLAGESSCNVALEVRVVPTEGGYYLLARDIHGRVRERVVPDGASAGVLVASWASDDQLGPDEPAPNVPRPAELDRDDDDATPAPALPSAPIVPSPPIVAITARSTPFEPTTSSKWLRFELLDNVEGIGGTGVRAEVDVWQWHGWSVGLGASIANGEQSTNSDYGMTPMSSRDIDGLAYVARTSNVLGWLHLRGALAAGARVTTGSLEQVTDANGNSIGATGVRPIAGASLLAGAELGHGWAVEVGVLADAVPAMVREVEVKMVGYTALDDLDFDRTISVQLFAGLAHKL